MIQYDFLCSKYQLLYQQKPNKSPLLTSLSKYRVLQGVSVSTRCLSSVRCLSSRTVLCSVAFSTSFCRKASVTCCHRRLQRIEMFQQTPLNTLQVGSFNFNFIWPGFSRSLLLYWPHVLLRHRQPGDVDHPHLSVSEAELQDAVPLALYAAHHCIGGVVLHLCCYPKRVVGGPN